MIIPENKLCPMTFSSPGPNGLCLGEICMWFGKDNGVCLVARPAKEAPLAIPVEVETTAPKTRATSRKKDTAIKQ